MLSTRLRMATSLAVLVLCLTIIHRPSAAQENAQLAIPPSLIECYNTSYFMNRDNRLPSNLETLITLIEKIENTNDYQQDMRKLAVALIQRFRQDGIQKAPNIQASPGVIPYSPTGYQFPKFRILVSRLIPGNANQFPNSSLTREERCSLHFMLSSSLDTRVRGDENTVCNQMSQYRAQRVRRDVTGGGNGGSAAVTKKLIDNNFVGDVELLENIRSYKRQSSGQYVQQISPDVEYDYGGYPGNSNTNNNNDVSLCPVENGVIWTPYGTVSAGTLIAGIAAGTQQQYVQLRTLLAQSRRPGLQNMPQVATIQIDNRWAATLAGDLAEVALVQVPVSSTGTASVGANGAWNSTVMPKWYFLSKRYNLEMTDAEIRGGIDGLTLAMNVAQWRTQAPNLKISQLLRMYYSMDGVLGSGIKACNRQQQFQNLAPDLINTMITQTSGFAQVLDREMQLHVTLSADKISQFSTAASNALYNYVPQSLNDVSCAVGNAQPQDISELITPITNIYVFLDTTWQYNNIADYINYILQRLNINPYASQVTLLCAADGSVMVNTTNLITDVNAKWNVTTHATFSQGFNLPTILRTVQNLTQTYMNAQRTNNSVGGQSMVALLVPYMTQVSESDSTYATNNLNYIYEQIPDLRFIYYGGGSINRFAAFVQNPDQDLYALNTGSSVAGSAGPVLMRIKKIPRRIINPRCGANWYSNSWGTDQMNQYVRPGMINFYRVAPNYYFGSGSGRYVNVQSQTSLQFTVCSSRSVILPVSNNGTGNTGINTGSSTDQNCIQINSGNGFAYDLSNACNGYKTIHQCPPLYISVQAPANSGNGQTQTVSCSDAACQTPDQARYTVSVVNLGCYNSVAGLAASFATILLAFFLHQLAQ